MKQISIDHNFWFETFLCIKSFYCQDLILKATSDQVATTTTTTVIHHMDLAMKLYTSSKLLKADIQRLKARS